MNSIKLLLFHLAFLLVSQVQGQDADNTIYFQVTCGAGAQTSMEIQNFKNLVLQKDSLTIKRKLVEGSNLEQVLSSIVLKHYYSNGIVKLSKTELNKIKEVSNSKRKFSLCFTCTFQQKGTVRQLFNKEKYQASYFIIKDYLLNTP